MKSILTVKVKIRKDDRLIKTLRIYTRAIQFAINTAWRLGLKTRRRIHDECYHEIREKFKLQAQLAVCVISQASEMINNNPKSKPQVGKHATIRYNFPRSATIKGDWRELSLATVDGRVTVNLDIPEYYQKYLNWEVRESNLLFRSGELYFYFTLAKEVDTRPKRDDFKVLGVDLGVNKIATTSDGDFYGKEVKRKRGEKDRFVAELQAKGTHAAHNRLKAKSGEWKRFMTWRNHVISRRIVDKLDEGDVLVMEDLKNIRRTAKYNEWVHK
ncbi:hypothetical protein AKJ48_00395 [candidate division MSBL1 archaeon SCGC-AAA261O19]|uniref:Transposase n=1 Tax=candidate division MSBL1 archaeon SCGC-AAA261O19 TaxID=1698277 RepID=A0A133VF54_9EURY|nr:hypothetical protein AKJ48_00395 [candidate division MSBL1 archaeon SCGC-AAA261O19]